MENLLKILILLLLIIIIILLIGIVTGIIYLYRKKILTVPQKTNPIELNCHNHPQLPSAGSCAICSHNFCEACLKENDKLHFCLEHYQLFLNHEWEEIEMVKTTPDQPEKAMHLYRFKENKWSQFQLPTYIVTHYKIDIDNDHIESHVKLYGRKEESQVLMKDLEISKNSH